MIGKNNHYLRDTKDGTKVESYSIKKFKVGTASVVIGASIFLGAGAVAQASEEVSNNTTADNTTNAGAKENVPTAPVATAQPVAKETTKEDVAAAVAAKLGGETAKEVKALDKTKLENYIAEIEAKLTNGTYGNKTEESVAVLKADLEAAKATLVNATTQDEITRAYSKLVTTANTKLKAKAVEKKETPAVDTTNGKETVGKKAENTEKKSESNSIENTGSKDPRNGKALDENNAFRTEATAATHEATTNKVGNISYTVEFSDDANKEIYLYNQEDTNIDITVNSTAGNISSVKVRGGGNRPLDEATKDSAVQIDGFGWSYTQTLTETAGPVTMNITGKSNERFLGLANTNRREDQNSVLGDRYLVVTDAAGGSVSAASNGSNQPGFFKLVVKSQTYKYSIQQPEIDGDKIGVDDINNLTAADIQKIKDQINIEYSKTSTDARLASKKGTALENKSDVVKNIEVSGGNITVTYKDDSTDTATISSVVRNNTKPTVDIEYSDPAPDKKEVYVYASEVNTFDIKIKDDSGKIASAELKRGSNQSFKDVAGETNKQDTQYGFTANKITAETTATAENPAVITYTGTPAPEGAFTQTKLEEVTRGENPPGIALGWRFVNALDKDGLDARGNGRDATDPTAVNVILKAQTNKYDITVPATEDKVTVADPAAVTDAEFEKVKDKLKIEFSKTNPDKRLESKRGQNVDDKDDRISTITKVGNDLVVTYKDGSVDKKSLAELTKLDKQPAIDAVNTAATEKIAAINATPNATDEEKAAAVAKVNADKTAALTAINDATTKTTLDTAKESGTTAISADNPVVAKKDAAKADVEAARKAKEDAIKADTNLTQEEKDAAIAKNNTAAADATKAIDTATTNDAVDQAKTAGTTAIGKVNPVAKENAKEAIANALTAKNSEIDKRTDLSDAEKKAAKDEAQKLADAELAKINAQPDNADTPETAAAAQKLVAGAEDKGVADVTAVNPVVKEAAKKAVADELTKKEEQIDARTDLTTEEKAAAKEEAKAKAKEATDAIDAQPSITDSADKATAAQKVVDAAKDKGVADVKAVNPEAAKKTEAKKAIDNALTAKNNAIDARTDLTPEEKTKAKEIAKAKAEAAKDAVEKAATNAEVDKAKTDGTTAVSNVTPVAKDEAKKAIAKALEDKNAEIDKRTDLTDEEKTAAKNEAKDKADTQLAEIAKQPDAADTKAAAKTAQDAVDAAKKTGVDEVTAVNPVAVKKTEAKKAVGDALTAKNNAIDARTDLTGAEKKAAKDKAAEEARKAKEAIDAATTDAAVDTAKTSGLGEVAKVNPVAKEAAKKAVADELAKKTAEIDARTDLTDAEKAKAKKDAQDKAKAATDAINAQPDNADTPEKATEAQTAVNNAKDKGVADVKSVNPVAKEAAKKAVADELAKKEAEIDARTDLTQEEKEAAKKDAQDKAKTATDAINAQPDNADTPEKAAEAQKAVDAAKKSGVDEVAAVNPEAVTRPAAKKAIDDKLAKQLEDIANTPDATDEEKKAAADAAKTLAEEAKKAIDKAGTDAEVNKLQEEAKKEIEKSVPVVEDKPNARKAIEDEAKAKKEALDARTDLSPKAKEVLKAKVDKVAEKAKEAIDAVSSVEDVNTIEEADKTAIKAIGEVNRPIDKVLVKDPSALTAEEKAKILEEVKKVNPTAKEVKYDDNGNIEVTTEAGDKGIIDPTKLVKTEDQLDNGKGGNDINKPLDKVIVKDPSKLTAEEKAKIVAEVEEVNPDAIVTIDENGTVSVSTPDGKTAAIPASELVRTKEDTANPDAGNSKIVKPADKLVGNPTNPDDRAKVEEKLKELNPEAKSVIFDENGNATVTLKDGTTATIPEVDLFKSEAYLTEPKAGNDVVKPADKTVVTNPEKLTDAEKKAIEDKVKAVNPGATVVVDDKGNTLVTTPEGKTAVIPATDLVKSPEDATKPKAGNDIVKPADKTAVTNPEKLTDAEKKAIEDKVRAVNPGATVVVDDKGNATVTTPEGKTAVIPATDLVKSPEDATKPNAGNDIVKPADKTAVTNPEKLTDAEKKAIEDKVKVVNPGATVVVDDKGNATVTTPEGKTAVIPAADLVKSPEDATKLNAGNDIVKPADKTAVANKDALTLEEKKEIEDKVKAVNPGATVAVDDKGNATVTTPEGKAVVISATDLVKTSEDTTKPNAGNDIVKPANKVLVKDPAKLTDLEKKAIENSVVAVNPGAYVTVDDNGNVVVTTRDGKTAVIPVSEVTRTEEDTTKANAGNDVNIPSAKTVVADPEKLTDAEKKAIEDKVKAVNPGATVVVDDKGNATVTTPEGKTAVIPAKDLTKKAEDATKVNAGNDVNTPAAKTVVENPEKLTDAEKKAIEDKVKAVNPGATVVVDDKGNATVTTPEGKTAVISATDLVIPAENLTKEATNAKVKTPAIRILVGDKENLTDVEKAAVKKAIEDVNPGAKVVVDDKGNATVTLPDGSTATIAKEQLVKDKEDAKAKNAGDNLEFDYSKVTVTDIKNITPEEKAKFQFMILGAITDVEEFDISTLEKTTDAEGNTVYTSKDGKVKITIDKDGNATIEKDGKKELAITIDKDGNVTIVTKDGKVLAIPTADAFKEKSTDASTEGRINTPANRVLVTDEENLTPEELAMIKESVGAVNLGATVEVDAKGNVTVTTKDGKSATISVDQLVKTLVDVVRENDGNNINLNFEKQEVTDLTNLTNEDKAAAKAKILAVNPNAADVIFDAKGNATVVLKDGKAYTILAKDIFSQKGEVAPSERNNNGAANSNAQGVNSKLGQRLANTGTTETNTGLAGLGLGILGGLLAAARRRKNDKN